MALIGADSEARAGGRSSLAVAIGAVALACAIVIFGFEIHTISAVNGWWIDELFSIWASDPTLGIVDAISQRIMSDTNPPLYFFALYLMRLVCADERTAILILNFAALSLGAGATIMMARKSGLTALALLGGAAFILSGPILRYSVEGRAYLMAMVQAYVAAWMCALAIRAREACPSLLGFALLGVAAALTHLFAGLVCASLGAGLVCMAIVYRRVDLLRPALALIIPASIVTLTWVIYAHTRVNMISWIEPLSLKQIKSALWELEELEFGSHSARLLFLAMALSSIFFYGFRSLGFTLGIALAVFMVVPILVSVKQPIIAGRYLMIGLPIVDVFLYSFVYHLFNLRYRAPTTKNVYLALIIVFMTFASLSDIFIIDLNGFEQARLGTEKKLIWRGAEAVEPLIHDCPAGSIRVIGPSYYYAFTVRSRPEIFTDAEDSPNEAVAPGSCPIVGWEEHAGLGLARHLGHNHDLMKTATDQDLLKRLNFIDSTEKVRIIRYDSGFVVLRQEARSSIDPTNNNR